MDRFSALPDEVLEVILEKLTAPEDLASCSNAHLAFENILLPTKTAWIFYKVFPNLLTYLNRADVLRCRLICVQWKTAVDRVLEDFSSILCGKLISAGSLMDWYFWPKTSQMITDFLNVISLHSENTFLTRCLRLGMDLDATESTDYWSYVQLLLQNCGSRVQRCKFSFADTPVNLVYILRGCLSHLPNLISLEISNLSLYGASCRRYDKLVTYLQQNPFPPLPYLEHLAIHNAPDVVFELVLPSYNCSLKSLEFRHAQLSNMAYESESEKEILPPMENLEILLLSVNQEHLLKFPRFMPRLTKLIVLCPHFNNGETIGKILNNCRASLKQLVISQKFNQGSRLGSSFAKSLPDEMPYLQEITIVNPNTDWLENYIGVSGKGILKKSFCKNIEKLQFQWRTHDLEQWLQNSKISQTYLPLTLHEVLSTHSTIRSPTLVETIDFMHELERNLALWNTLSKLKSCYFSGYSTESGVCIFSRNVKRTDVCSNSSERGNMKQKLFSVSNEFWLLLEHH